MNDVAIPVTPDLLRALAEVARHVGWHAPTISRNDVSRLSRRRLIIEHRSARTGGLLIRVTREGERQLAGGRR